MAIPQTIPPVQDTDAVCKMGERWLISHELAQKLALMASFLPYPLQIISGYRTPELQAQLTAVGAPAAPDHLSTHRTCPAIGADVWPPTVTPVSAVKAAIGEAGMRAGLRWGGGSRVDPSTGIPSDWNHFDLGPRSAYGL